MLQAYLIAGKGTTSATCPERTEGSARPTRRRQPWISLAQVRKKRHKLYSSLHNWGATLTATLAKRGTGSYWTGSYWRWKLTSTLISLLPEFHLRSPAWTSRCERLRSHFH